MAQHSTTFSVRLDTPSRALQNFTIDEGIIRRSRPAFLLLIKDLRSQMGLAHSVFRTGEKADFERMLDDMLGRVKP